MALVNVIKYNGSPDVFAWKYPNEELGTWTQLIVNESQEAVLYKGGQALDWFAAGRHTLKTENIPILSKLINLPFGGRSPFSAEIWYVNKANSLDIKWGTNTPIQIQDPKYKVFVSLRAYGQFGIVINNSKTFLQKLMGTLPVFDKTNMTNYFKGLYIAQVKDTISAYLIKKGISILEINAYLVEISDYLHDKMTPILENFGVGLVNFYFNDVSTPDDDSTIKQLKDALAKKAEMDIVGYSYSQERSFGVLDGIASNQNATQSGLLNAGLGLSMGLGMGGAVGKHVAGLAGQIDISDKKAEDTVEMILCTKCGTENNLKTKFCSECGARLGRFCGKCGVHIEGSPKFCPECGETLVRKCSDCGMVIEGTPKFCPECGFKQ